MSSFARMEIGVLLFPRLTALDDVGVHGKTATASAELVDRLRRGSRFFRE